MFILPVTLGDLLARLLKLDLCIVKNALRAVYPAFISVYLFHLIALYFNVISANISQWSQNTRYKAMKKLGVVLNFGWSL